MLYKAPNTVTAPQDVLEIIEIIHDGGAESVSIARLRWDGVERFGIRWNVSMNEWNDKDKIREKKVCLGMPISYSHPVWFILPSNKDESVEKLIQILK